MKDVMDALSYTLLAKLGGGSFGRKSPRTRIDDVRLPALPNTPKRRLETIVGDFRSRERLHGSVRERSSHEFVPHRRDDKPRNFLFHRAVVVVARPRAYHKIWRIAQDPSVAVVVGSTGLGGNITPREVEIGC